MAVFPTLHRGAAPLHRLLAYTGRGELTWPEGKPGCTASGSG